MKKKPLVTAIYCRVDRGGAKEARQMGIDGQKNKLQRYAKGKGLKIVACYEDDGFSGNDLSRPALKRLMSDFQEGKFEVVLVTDRCRLFRGMRLKEPKWPFKILITNQLEISQAR